MGEVMGERSVRDRALSPLLMLLLARLRRAASRFASLAARAAAGKLRPARVRRAVSLPDEGAADPRLADPGPTTVPDAGTEASPRLRLPCRKGWLFALLGWQIGGFGSQLTHLVENDAEMQALLAVSPQARRLIRQILWPLSLGQPLPASLALPPRLRPARRPPAAPVPPSRDADPPPAGGPPPEGSSPPEPPPEQPPLPYGLRRTTVANQYDLHPFLPGHIMLPPHMRYTLS